MANKKTPKETNADVLRLAMLRRLPRRTSASGQIRWPAIPSLLEHYTQTLGGIFAALGRRFNDEELGRAREILANKLKEGFALSPFSKVVVNYHTEPPPNTLLSYTISYAGVSIADEYAEWVANREPPLFGSHADAKVLDLARSLGDGGAPILDVGAGTGRNTLPLLKEGFSVDAVELAPALAAILRGELQNAGFDSTVFEGDALDPVLEIPKGRYGLVVLAEVVASHFRSVDEIRRLFERASEWLRPGGLLLFSAFLSTGGYKPDSLAREASQIFWTCLFSRADLDRAAEGLPLVRVSDESVHDYEEEHLPKEAWPPTGWFAEWAQGQDLFDVAASKSPLELRWLAYRKTP